MLNFTIRRKLFLSYVLFSVLPSIILGTILSNSIKTEAVNRALLEATWSVETIADNFMSSLSAPVNITDQLYLSLYYSQLVETQYDTSWDVVSSYFLFEDFESWQKVYGNQIDDIRIYVDNDTILENWYLYKINESVAASDWYKMAIAHPGRIIWVPTVNEKSFLSKNRYSLVRLISSKKTNAQSIVLIDVNTTYITNRLKAEAFDISIFDENGNVLCTNDAEHAAQSVADYSFATHPFSNTVAVYDGDSREGKAKVIIKDATVEGSAGRFRIVSSFLLSEITQESNSLFARYIVLTAGCLLLVSGLVFFFSRRLRDRVEILQSEMEQVSKGDFNLVSSISGTDEVGVLSQSLNVMTQNLKTLVEENYEANLQKQNLLAKHNAIKLKQLTNQMNPHFLFNTLESLRMEARIHNELEIADIIRRLGVLLRKSFRAGNEEVPLADEISMVEDYLCIQAFRHGDKIGYHVHISDEARSLLALPFLVQPIVENAIIHGLENSESGGEILIHAFCDENSLTVEVADNGAGMTDERLQEVMASLDDETEDDLHIGIRNVHLRIRLRYGAAYGLTIENERGRTVVRIRIPKVVM